jgi:hypothetical protein
MPAGAAPGTAAARCWTCNLSTLSASRRRRQNANRRALR